ncbi:putative alcohol dehydrogenase [Xylariales sp. AK1849]|nr:putative alcohol dehydrogenase [Xylariales sp. AK1849]
MAPIESNQAAWQVEAKVKPLKVGPGPDQSKPEVDEVIIEVAAVAINPSEWKTQDHPFLPLQYPHVLGSDVAGTVVKVGSGVTRFKLGDRVIGHCLGLVHGGARHGGFQKFTACREPVVAVIPDSLPFEQAVVLPLSISTSSSALFAHLKLRLPTPEGSRAARNEIILIWGAASSMGSTAIQLAVAAGYNVITTASAKNHEYVKSLTSGDHVAVLEYAEPDIASKIIEHIKTSGSKFAGAYDCIGTEPTVRACAEVTNVFGGGPLPIVLPAPEGLPEDVQAETVWATNPGMVPGHPGAEVWAKFVPQALKAGTFQAKPDPFIVGQGLERVQETIDLSKKGVSAKKLVVTL